MSHFDLVSGAMRAALLAELKVWRGVPQTIRQLVNATGRGHASVHQNLAALEKSGLVRKVPPVKSHLGGRGRPPCRWVLA